MSISILVVDDDVNSREVLALLLSGEGYGVDVCEGPLEALQELSARAYDILLTDYVMPAMSGLELTRRASALHGALRCFIITGQPPPATLDLGQVTWVAKPLDFDELLVAMNS